MTEAAAAITNIFASASENNTNVTTGLTNILVESAVVFPEFVTETQREDFKDTFGVDLNALYATSEEDLELGETVLRGDTGAAPSGIS